MNNNRQFEIKSLKGPRRKLVLEVIDGKRFIKKSDLQHYFFEENWRIPDFRYHFGLGHRIVRGSLYKYFTKEEIKDSHKKKLSLSQLGDKNSNKCNWYRPRKLIPLTQLEEAIKVSHNKKEVKESLNLTSWDLSFLQQYYNFRLPKKNFIDKFAGKHLTSSEVTVLSKLLESFDLGEDIFSGRILREAEAIKALVVISYELRFIIKKLKKGYRKTKLKMPTNMTEYAFYKELVKIYPNVIPQYYIRSLDIRVDFLLDEHNILELDGNMHELFKDKERDLKLKELGYTVHRLDLEKLNLKHYKNNNSKVIRQCLKNLRLHQ